MDDLIHRELSAAIIGAVMKVLNTLRPGLDEKLYENALVIELRNLGTASSNRNPFPFIMRAGSSARSFPI